MRLFIAINLTQEMKEALIDIQNDWYDAGVRGNFSPEENLHLTLAFIGEYPDPDRVTDALRTVTFSPIPLTLEGVGAFGDLWWAGLKASPALEAVAKRIRRALSVSCIPFDRKRFSPHITLLRKASEETIPPVCVSPVEMNAGRISLMRSDLGRNGMIYTELGTVEGI